MPRAQAPKEEVEGNGLEQSDEEKTKDTCKDDRPMPFSIAADGAVATNYIL